MTVPFHVRFGGGSVIVWGGISMSDRTTFHVVQTKFICLLGVWVNVLVFQDDNARAHRARIVNAHLQQHNIYRMPWPAVNPDLSPTEHVWDMIGRRVRQRQRPATTLVELGQALQEEWNTHPQMAIRRNIRLTGRKMRLI